jgi:hypothetical protein
MATPTTNIAVGVPAITNSYGANNGVFNCFDDMNSCLLGLM